ncbi:MAG: phosphoenolpyruvate carboxylase, partial [Deinococcus sp.]
MNEDGNLLGRMLGTLLSEQGGSDCLERVERVRSLVRQARSGGDDAPLRALLAGANAAQAENLVRAFGLYFQLVNLAEEYERVRVLTAGSGPRPQSLAQALIELKQMGFSADEAEGLIGRLDLGLTFTAHPTEMRRRTVRAHLVEVARDIPSLDSQTAAEASARIGAHIEALWSTPELRRLKPTVLDEVKGGLSYVSVIAQALPQLQHDLETAFQEVYGRETQATLPLSFSSWMGGDRDGNPSVTPEATRETLELHRERARELLLSGVQRAYADLSQDDGEGGEELEPYRAELQALHREIGGRDAGPGGDSRVDLVPRLERLGARLRAHGQRRSAELLLGGLLSVARVFGQHLVSLDLREHSGLTGEAVAGLLREAGVEGDYLGLPEHARLELLTRELRSRRPLWPAGEPLPPGLERAIGPIREVARAVERVG